MLLFNHLMADGRRYICALGSSLLQKKQRNLILHANFGGRLQYDLYMTCRTPFCGQKFSDNVLHNWIEHLIHAPSPPVNQCCCYLDGSREMHVCSDFNIDINGGMGVFKQYCKTLYLSGDLQKGVF